MCLFIQEPVVSCHGTRLIGSVMAMGELKVQSADCWVSFLDCQRWVCHQPRIWWPQSIWSSEPNLWHKSHVFFTAVAPTNGILCHAVCIQLECNIDLPVLSVVNVICLCFLGVIYIFFLLHRELWVRTARSILSYKLQNATTYFWHATFDLLSIGPSK